MDYRTQESNVTFTGTLQFSLTLAESTQFLVLTVNSLETILIVSALLRLGLPKGLLLVGFKKTNLWLTAPKGATPAN